MNKKYILAFVLLGLLSAGAIVLASEVQYPVKELGNCTDKESCKAYCDDQSHVSACLNFAEKNNLMPAKEIDAARKFSSAGAGPGGCTTKDACETYCDSVSHMDECIAFAEKNGFMPPDELAEAKKIQAAKARGVKMPSCGSKKQCDTYCAEPAHMEECITFAQEADFMSPKELEESKKALAAIKAGAILPPCKGKEACDAYCSEDAHFDVCMNFAIAAGFMDAKDAEMAKKTRGKGPGGCRGKEACDAFCQSNMEACAQFAYENGMTTKDEFEMMKKTGGKGPGDCKSKEECEGFCNNPDNQEACFNFGKEHGMIPEADLKRMEEGKQQFKESMQNMPPEVYSCLESAVGADMMAKFKSGVAMPSQDIGEKMRACFDKVPHGPQGDGGPGSGGSMAPGDGSSPGSGPRPDGMTSPGGCTNPEECQKYCEANPEICKSFQSQAPNMPGNAPAQGFQPMQCKGENCPPPPSAPGGAFGPGPLPCEGENCPAGDERYRTPQQPTQPGGMMQPEGQPGSFTRSEGEGYVQPPPPPGTPPGPGPAGTYNPPAGMAPPEGQQPFIPPTGPGAGGGSYAPGDYVPLAPPSGETAPPPPPPPQEQPTSYLGSFLGLMLYSFGPLLPL